MLPHVNEKLPEFPSELLRAYQNARASSTVDPATPMSEARTVPMSPGSPHVAPTDKEEDTLGAETQFGDDVADEDQNTEEIASLSGISFIKNTPA